VLRILISTVLMTLLPAGSEALDAVSGTISSSVSGPGSGVSAAPAAEAGPASPPRPDEGSGLPPRRGRPLLLSRPPFGWPLAGHPVVVRAFRAPTVRYGPGHRGVDLATTPAAPVLAAGTGTVIFAGTVAGRGVVSVEHSPGDPRGGLRTTYEPVSPTVTAGQQVRVGEQIGTVQAGHAGCTVAVCLHWGAYRGPGHDERSYLDPLRLLAWPRVRLLPVEPAPEGA
jgi:murein DD-endopeptidase MepM/ murein hydrolase activator NlpD